MELKLESRVAKVTVDLTEEQIHELMTKALSYAFNNPQDTPKTVVVATPPPIERAAIPTSAPTPVPKPIAPAVQPVRPPAPVKQQSYKCFLYIECESCGKMHAFMPKTHISQAVCECGHKTPLKDMRELYMDCKCGQKFKYMTNSKKSVLSMNCIVCGAPVDLEYHEKRNNYQTIK